MLFHCLPSWESYLWCGLETQGPSPTSTAPHCGPAPIGSTTNSLGRTLGLGLEMVARCTLSTHGLSAGRGICESGLAGPAAGGESGERAEERCRSAGGPGSGLWPVKY